MFAALGSVTPYIDTGSSRLSSPSSTSCRITTDANVLVSDARWKMVESVAATPPSTSAMPKPRVHTISPSTAMPAAMPGMP